MNVPKCFQHHHKNGLKWMGFGHVYSIINLLFNQSNPFWSFLLMMCFFSSGLFSYIHTMYRKTITQQHFTRLPKSGGPGKRTEPWQTLHFKRCKNDPPVTPGVSGAESRVAGKKTWGASQWWSDHPHSRHESSGDVLRGEVFCWSLYMPFFVLENVGCMTNVWFFGENDRGNQCTHYSKSWRRSKPSSTSTLLLSCIAGRSWFQFSKIHT